ncbi:MAG: twin transmembrane helix small protein [Methylococcales bacterium]|nr:twin transmembrane helix small protein [Methylococcales bacterium]
MPIKIIFIIIFLFILFSLGSALFHLVTKKDSEHSGKTVKALSYRIGISLVLFILLYIAVITGLIKPEGIGARMQMQKQQNIQNTNTQTP